jgi:DNA invertase Pin-like site-specific DNA recombinase
MKQAIIYARVSSKDQEREGYSIPAQLKLLREYARTHDLEIVEEFVDVETAKCTGRKQFGEMTGAGSTGAHAGRREDFRTREQGVFSVP